MIDIEIISPEKKIFEGKVKGVQLPGIDGSFEIFQLHAPLISALKKGNIEVIPENENDSNKRQSFLIEGGFAEIINNKLSVLLS